MISKTILAGFLVWGAFLLVLFCLRPKSRLHAVTMENYGKAEIGLSIIVMITLICICTLPMGLSPHWNGEKIPYLRQYERMAESILDGHLYIDYQDIDPVLLSMENPYNYEARQELGVSYYWDHAFYNGHYYMYFGVVPVFLLFLPYHIIFGTSLAAYHATQIFTAMFICGIFSVFHLLARLFFRKMTFSLYLTLSAAFSAISVWYAVEAPALYCTAITAGICMEIWSLFFFFRSVWGEAGERKSILFAFFGSLFGALAFGCRPPIAIANILVIPMLIVYLRGKKCSPRLIGQLLIAASPYLVVGALLMAYNYARFGSPFEFGQAYQLTITDQSNYGSILSRFDMGQIFSGIISYFLSYELPSWPFPYISFNGVLFNFPILFLAFFGIASKGARKEFKENHLGLLITVMAVTCVIIAVSDIFWAPTVRERYRMDVYWLMGLLCFIVIGFWFVSLSAKSAGLFSCLVSIWAFLTFCKSVWLYMIPFENNFTQYFPERLEKIRKIIMLGRGVGLI